jgi:CO/xanthine dehydrogenase FAD-binding subunit
VRAFSWFLVAYFAPVELAAACRVHDNDRAVYYQPKSLDEALDRKAELGARGALLAGGTDLVVLFNRGIPAPESLIDLSRCDELRRVRRAAGMLELGGSVTFAACARLGQPALAAAALGVGGPGIREMGTIAGNLATASPAGDGSTALLALDAEVELRSSRARRRVPIAAFFTAYRKTALAPDELIARVRIPLGYRSAWGKIGKRAAVNISIAAGAVAVAPDGSPRIAFASVAPTPVRCPGAEAWVAENGYSPDSLARAAEIARDEVRPIDDHRASADYKRHLVAVLVRRLLAEVAPS